ncbi:hypothetical protein WKE96_13500 [Edwardsiella tarda]|uniref:hypothetical protein n=1 Tax=Edwardsiella tarda TaxID=636 RepID=UPI0039BE24C9
MFIQNTSDLIKNINKFNTVLDEPGIIDLLGKFRRWYAYKNQDNEWILAPSKFIGYLDVSVDTYLNQNNGFDGRETEKRLQSLSREPSKAELKATREKLSQMCASFGKKENKISSIRIVDSVDIPPQDVIVSSLITLINALPIESRKEIINSIYLP